MKARPSPWLTSVMSGISAPAFHFDNDPFGDGAPAGNPADPFDPILDRPRLANQQATFEAFMVRQDRFLTLAEIQAGTGIPEASASARFRGSLLRRERRHRANAPRGTYEYRVFAEAGQ